MLLVPHPFPWLFVGLVFLRLIILVLIGVITHHSRCSTYKKKRAGKKLLPYSTPVYQADLDMQQAVLREGRKHYILERDCSCTQVPRLLEGSRLKRFLKVDVPDVDMVLQKRNREEGERDPLPALIVSNRKKEDREVKREKVDLPNPISTPLTMGLIRAERVIFMLNTDLQSPVSHVTNNFSQALVNRHLAGAYVGNV